MKYDCVFRLNQAGISVDDAFALRRISMTLHRWHELECGDGNQYGSWCITRGHKGREPGPRTAEHTAAFRATFTHDDDGRPYLEHHHWHTASVKDAVTYTPLADRERGAIKRLDKIMARYPGFVRYIQTDPRGCALYILTPERLERYAGQPIDSIYNNGIAVFK